MRQMVEQSQDNPNRQHDLEDYQAEDRRRRCPILRFGVASVSRSGRPDTQEKEKSHYQDANNERQFLGPGQSHKERYTAAGINGEGQLMSSGIGSRLARLEKAIGAPRMYTIIGPHEVVGAPDFDVDTWLRAQGHDVENRDLVVILSQFGSAATEPVMLVSASER